MPDGKVIDGTSWETSPYSIAKGIRLVCNMFSNASEGLANDAIIAKVNGVLWDLDRVLEGDCALQILKFDDDEAKAVFFLNFS